MIFRSAIVSGILFTVFQSPAIGDNLRHQITDLCSANTLTDLVRMAVDALEKARVILMSLPVPSIDLTRYVNFVEGYWQIFAGVVSIITILFLLKVMLPTLIAGPDWSRYTSEQDFKTKCIEPLLKDWRFSYVKDRPCRLSQGHETLEGNIDYYLYDGEGAITIIEDKKTINDEDELRSARAQARSHCFGLYIFENIVVNSFVIASMEGLWIYRIKHNEDRLVERVIPKNLKGSKKRQIKDKLLEIR